MRIQQQTLLQCSFQNALTQHGYHFIIYMFVPYGSYLDMVQGHWIYNTSS